MKTAPASDQLDVVRSPVPFTFTGQVERVLGTGWERTRVAAGACEAPEALGGLEWQAAAVPGTVLDSSVALADLSDELAWDHWYRCRFALDALALDAESGHTAQLAGATSGGRQLLCFDGLATLADVWLNGQPLLAADNMFRAYVRDVTGLLRDENVLTLRFRSLTQWLKQRRPRGRWPTRLVTEKNLRHVRTSLLGFMPGWYPAAPLIGPWRPVRLVSQSECSVDDLRLTTDFFEEHGSIDVHVTCRLGAAAAPIAATLELVGLGSFALGVRASADGGCEVFGRVAAGKVEPWWPHTHGTPRLYAARIALRWPTAAHALELGHVGFRRIERVRDARSQFALHVNGVAIFCRGACLAPLSVTRGHTTEPEYRAALELAREGGMNMLRVGGTMVYESDHFYRLCDELGILVWQDFMFANMDYPIEVTAFADSCRAEAEDFLRRVAVRPSLAVLCGNSEVAQQAAMLGIAREAWGSALFDEILPAICGLRRPDVPYVASSPMGGDLPFHVDAGPGHYYGVGAYLRPLEDVYVARVQFTSECLGFSQVPDESSLQAFMGELGLATQHPRYRAGVPRDNGAAWDFGDVTDHYVERLFGADVRTLRYADPERYLALCRVATGRVMESVFGVWRRGVDACSGGLVWMYRDVQPGAGWGVVDVTGRPKAAYYHLKRIFAPIALWFVDAGVNGLRLHLANDRPVALCGVLTLRVCRADGFVTEQGQIELRVEARAELTTSVDQVLERFTDANYVYRFGPLAHAVVSAQFDRAPGPAEAPAVDQAQAQSQWRAFYLVGSPAVPDQIGELGLTAVAETLGVGSYRVTVRSAQFAESVAVEAPGYLASDNYFHVPAGESHCFTLTACGAAAPLRGKVRPLNAARFSMIQNHEMSLVSGGAA